MITLKRIDLYANRPRGASDRIAAGIYCDGVDTGQFVTLHQKSAHGRSEVWHGTFYGVPVAGSQADVKRQVARLITASGELA